MDHIPARENLASMSRADIQKLCKRNNIKANMRTDQMVNALCDLVDGRDVPRPHRYISEKVASHLSPKSRGSTLRSALKVSEISSKKTMLQRSKFKTNPESNVDTPASGPSTRRKTKDLQQLHLGTSQPIIAGESGVTDIRTSSLGAGRNNKAAVIPQEAPTAEEEGSSVQVPTDLHTAHFNIDKAALPSPIEIEATVINIPVFKELVEQVRTLQLEIKRLEASQGTIQTEMTASANLNSQLKDQTSILRVDVQNLVAENVSLRQQVGELCVMLHGFLASAKGNAPSGEGVRFPMVKLAAETRGDVEKGKGAEAAVGPVAVTSPQNIGLSFEPRDPSPSQPVLGKRLRSPVETPDVSLSDIAGATQKEREDAEYAAIHRIIKPPKKKARLALDPDVAAPRFTSFYHGPGGPSSSSDPSHHRFNLLPRLFDEGHRAPIPVARAADGEENSMMSVDIDDAAVQGTNTLESNAVAGSLNARAGSSADTAPYIPMSKPVSIAPPTRLENSRAAVVNVHDPGFFSGPFPTQFRQSSQLPFPLRPTTREP